MLNLLFVHRQNYGSLPLSLVEYHNYAKQESVTPCFSQHNHDTMEMLSVLGGVLRITCNGERLILHQGDTVFFNPYDSHFGEIKPEDKEANFICLMLENKVCNISSCNTALNNLLGEISRGKSRFRTFFPAGEKDSDDIYDIVLSMHSHYKLLLEKKDAGRECMLMSDLFRLLAILQKHAAPTPPEMLNNRDLRFIQQVSAYVEKHYTGSIDVDSICADLGYGQRNFYRLFRQSFAMSFSEYLREYRIRCAAENYRGSELSVSEIAAAVGFTDYSYFSRIFKKYIGQSPYTYFRK